MKRLIASLFFVLVTATSAAAGLRLVMFEQAGCVYCDRWHAEVGDAYHLTTEGKTAPLWRLDIHQPLPDGVNIESLPVFTPTFILIDDTDTEIGRVEGYPGEDFFWGLLDQMLGQVTQQDN